VFLLVKEDGSAGTFRAMKALAAVVQMTSRDRLEDNLTRAAELIGEAAARGARLVALPENFALFTADEGDKQRARERLDGQGPILHAMAEAARAHGVDLVLGGMPEVPETADPRAYNACVYLDARGHVTARYRKIHLFDVAIPDGASYAESKSVLAGEQPVVVDSPLGKLGLSVCYDLRFPELYRELSRRGAELLAVPAAFTQHTGRDHWHVLLRARAVENLCYVLAPAQFGRHSERRVTYGHALIVDPWGQVIAEVGDHEGVAVAEIDLDYQRRLRRELPALEHRRL
jgi:predicted amidohydrolase